MALTLPVRAERNPRTPSGECGVLPLCSDVAVPYPCFLFPVSCACAAAAAAAARETQTNARSPLEDLPQQLLACVATLGVLCRASPAFLAPHLHCLLPYLKGENGLTSAEESEICRQVMCVWKIEWVLRHAVCAVFGVDWFL